MRVISDFGPNGMKNTTRQTCKFRTPCNEDTIEALSKQPYSYLDEFDTQCVKTKINVSLPNNVRYIRLYRDIHSNKCEIYYMYDV